MKARVAINGFGRIGRMVFRKAIIEQDFDIVAINASYPPETLAHLIKYDSNHGKFEGEVIPVEDGLIVNGKKYSCSIPAIHAYCHGESFKSILSLRRQESLMQKRKQ